MRRAILIDPYACQLDTVLLHDGQLNRQVYRYVRGAPITGVLLPNGDTAWYVKSTGTGQCWFALPKLLGPFAIGGCAVITGPDRHCKTTLDDLDQDLLWLAGPEL